MHFGPGYWVIKDDTTYQVVTDHLGSVRIVVNSQTGEVVQRIDYDVWGNIIHLQTPGEFTSGLYDNDTGRIHFEKIKLFF